MKKLIFAIAAGATVALAAPVYADCSNCVVADCASGNCVVADGDGNGGGRVADCIGSGCVVACEGSNC